jgi:hypothetical protein
MNCCYHCCQCLFTTTSSSDGGVSTTTTTCSFSFCFDYFKAGTLNNSDLKKEIVFYEDKEYNTQKKVLK